jgi:succinate-acetate transporter protein
MIKKVELLPPAGHAGLFAEPTPLGLLGLAVGCAALTPIAFGFGLTPAGLKTAAMFCLLFGGGGQFLCGLMNFANKNLFGGTIFTLFSFNWAMNWWALDGMAEGKMPDHHIVLAVDSLYLVVFLVLTYGFGFFSKLLVAFLVDIDLLYLAKVITGVTGTKALAIPTALLTVGLGLIALWIAFATLINPTAGRPIFKMAGPLFIAPRQKGFDWTLRNALFTVMFDHWQTKAFDELQLEDIEKAVAEKVPGANVLPELLYLWEYGAVQVTFEPGLRDMPQSARLTAAGIDLYEQLILKKYQF